MLAPWSSQRGAKVSYALATVSEEKEEIGKYFSHIHVHVCLEVPNPVWSCLTDKIFEGC